MSQQKNCITTDKGITYVIENMIGSGTGGQVYKAYKDNQNQVKEYVALKVQSNLETQEQQTLQTLSENKLNHIINILDLDQYSNYIIIIMDLAQGSFQEFWRNENILDIKVILQYFLQIVLGTQELHSLSLIHRDLKLDNVVYMEINNQKHLKLCDTGLMREKSGRKTITVGTPYYMAPEQINQNIYDEKVDIWALGMILYEMIARKTMVDGNSINSILHSILNLRQDEINQEIDDLLIRNGEYSQDVKMLLKQMINVRSVERSKAQVIAMKLKQILKIDGIQQSVNGLLQSQSHNFQFNNSFFKEQIRSEIQKEFEEKKNQEFQKLEEQHQKNLQQIKDESYEQHQKQMRDEIMKIRKELEVNLRVQFQQELKSKEQQLKQEYQLQLTQVNEKQQQELTNKYDEELFNQKQYMEQQFQQKVDFQISQKQKSLIQEMEQKIKIEQQNKEQFLKIQFQQRLSKQYQQVYEQKIREMTKLQNIIVAAQQNILKSKNLMENQLKELKVQLQQQQNPSQNYSLYNQNFQKQLEERLLQLQQLNIQISQIQVNVFQQQNQNSNQIDENLKKLQQIINSSQQILNPAIVDSFIKTLNLQLKKIAEEQTRLSIEHEQKLLQGQLEDYTKYTKTINDMISEKQKKLEQLNEDANLISQKDNQLQAQIQLVNQQFDEIRIEFKQLQSMTDNSKIEQQNLGLLKLNEQLNNFEMNILKAITKVSQQKAKDLQMIFNDLQRLIAEIDKWEQKIHYNNNEQQMQFSNEQQETLQQLNRQLLSLNEIKSRIQSLINQLTSNQIQCSDRIFVTIKTEFEISTFKIEQIYNNYINVLNRIQEQGLQKNQVIKEHKKLKEQLRNQQQNLQLNLDHLLNEYKLIQNVCKNEEKLQNVLLEIERQEKSLKKGFQERINYFNVEIADFENRVFQRLEEVELAECKISFKLDFISNHLKDELQKLNVIKQQATENKDEYLEQNFESFQKSLEELKTQLNNLLLTQTEQQCYDNIESQKRFLQESIKEYQQKLVEDIANTYLGSYFTVVSHKYQGLHLNLQEQVKLLQEKETFFKELIEKQQERIFIIEDQVQTFDHDQMMEIVRNYLDRCKKISENIESLQHQSENQDKQKLKSDINEFNNKIEIYREEIKELQKMNQENSVQFNNLQFYDRKIEIIKCQEFLFQLFCIHQRQMLFFQKMLNQNSNNQQLKKTENDLIQHTQQFSKIETCFNQYFSKNSSSQDQLLVQSINNYLQIENSSNQQSNLELSHELDLLKELQELNKQLENQSQKLKNDLKQKNLVKFRAKIKLFSKKPEKINEEKRQLFENLQKAFEHYIPKLKAINLEPLLEKDSISKY